MNGELTPGQAGRPPASALEREVAALEAEAADAPPGRRALFLSRAADLCLGAGQRARALAFYGRAIDGHLGGAHYDAAAAVCRKVLRISPRAVRTRATLAWLAVGKGLHGSARREIDDYVRSAMRAGEERRAARQLALMAQATLDPDLRRILAEHLARVGAVHDAERIMRELAGGRDARTPPGLEQREKLWEQVLRAALMGPHELDAAAADAQHPPDLVPGDETE